LAERFDLTSFAYAHRGLWMPDGLPENSMAAFLAAAEAGCGIEFDVRPAADGVPVCFHDPLLDRVTGETGLVQERTGAALAGVALNGGGTLPMFADLLRAWPATTPLLTELKIDGLTDPAGFAQTVGKMLLDHTGPAAAMSFSEPAVRALPEGLMRGQLVEPSAMIGEDKAMNKMRRAKQDGIDYLALHVADAPHGRDFQAAHPEMPITLWTVRDAEKSRSLRAFDMAQIFEGFDPTLAQP